MPAPAPLDRPEEWLVSGVDVAINGGGEVPVVAAVDGEEEEDEIFDVDAGTKSLDWYLIPIP
jgi:hypothetical protein